MTHLPNLGNILALDHAALPELVRQLRAFDPQAVEFEAAATNRLSRATQRGSVQIIPVTGPLSQKQNWFSHFMGWTTYDGLAADMEDAIANKDIESIVLNIDSPGGSVYGCPEIASAIMGMRGTKPIVAVANSFAASGAYWIGTAADELHVIPSGQVGSIGVISVHEDISGMLEAEGVKVTIVRSGKYKAEGNPFEPLSDEAADEFQRQSDYYYGMFVGSVAKGRGVSPSEVRKGFGEGRVVNAKDAIEMGMADKVSTLDEVVKRFNSGKGRRSASRVTRARMRRLELT